jgi:beta-galactosidase
VPYQPGTLRAVAFENGKQVVVDEVRTAGLPVRVKLLPDRSLIQSDGDDLSFITVRMKTKMAICPLADNLVRFGVTSAGTIAAVDKGNAATEAPIPGRSAQSLQWACTRHCAIEARRGRHDQGRGHYRWPSR